MVIMFGNRTLANGLRGRPRFGSFVPRRGPTHFLSFSATTFLLQSLDTTGPGRLGGMTFCGGMLDGLHHFTEFLQAVGPIPRLVAVSLAGDRQESLFADSMPVACQKSRLDRRRQRVALPHVPLQHDLAVHLVDVLAPRAAAADRLDLQLFERNRQVIVD